MSKLIDNILLQERKMKEMIFHSNGNYILVDEQLKMQTKDNKKLKENEGTLAKENEELRDFLERLDGEATHLQMAVEKLQRNQKQKNIRNLKFQIFKLQANNTMLAIEKLEELLKYIINSKWTKTVNVKHSPMQIIINKINEMINELKGVSYE